MLKILGRRTSGNAMKPLWLVDELGIAYEQFDIGGPFGGNDEAQYRAKNPMGLVPTLIDENFVLWESNAIVRYLAAKYALGTLCPSDLGERALAEQWHGLETNRSDPHDDPHFLGIDAHCTGG